MAPCTWRRVTHGSPCPLCGKPDNCSVSQDGQAVWCGRVAEGAVRENAGGQYLHRLTESRTPRPIPARPPQRERVPESPDLVRLAEQWTKNAQPHRERLADRLGVSCESLTLLGVGWQHGCWTFPERDATGHIIGITRRSPDGTKTRLKGTRAGLTYSSTWDTGNGPILLVEGASDTAAMMDLGLSALGRPSNTAGVAMLAEMLQNFSADRQIVVLGECDQKPDGSWPGREGAIRTAQGLADRLHRSIHWSLPPDAAKDVRAWLLNQGSRSPDAFTANFLKGLDLIEVRPQVQRPAAESQNRPNGSLSPTSASEPQAAEGDMPSEHSLSMSSDRQIPLGSRDTSTRRLVLSPKQTLPTAQAYMREFHSHTEGPTLYCYAGQLWEWRSNRYCLVEDNAVRQRLQPWLHGALRYSSHRPSEVPRLVDFESNPHSVSAALESLRALTHLDSQIQSPSWLNSTTDDLLPTDLIPCRTGLLHLPTMRLLPASPRYWTFNSLAFDVDRDAPLPESWYQFLLQLFDGDSESIELLQEWFGYCLTGDTSQQKMLLIVGPKRSGKGTIARVLTRLVGSGNACGPTISSLSGPFGLQPLIGKSLALVSDARFHGDGISTVVERLLCISGEDQLTVDRKHLTSVTVQLPTRLMFLTNELPRFTDASGALAGRFVILKLTRSFYGQEDTALTSRLLSELPGILNWAIEGLQRLRQRGQFLMPPSAQDAVQEIEDLSSPVAAFVRDCCQIGSDLRVSVNDLYDAWKRWCEQEGRSSIASKQVFGRDLAAAYPHISCRRGTDQRRFYQGITGMGDWP